MNNFYHFPDDGPYLGSWKAWCIPLLMIEKMMLCYYMSCCRYPWRNSICQLILEGYIALMACFHARILEWAYPDNLVTKWSSEALSKASSAHTSVFRQSSCTQPDDPKPFRLLLQMSSIPLSAACPLCENFVFCYAALSVHHARQFFQSQGIVDVVMPEKTGLPTEHLSC